jgi:hypothetical protein
MSFNMAAFATMALAEARARTLMAGGNMLTSGIVTAHPCRLPDGTLAVRVQRKVTGGAAGDATGIFETRQSKSGSWDILTDDTET